jgi:hypothetical protein
VRNWIDREELAAVRLGKRRVRVRQSELDRFIEASSSPSPRVDESVGGDLDEMAVAAWTELGIALADASSALGEQDRTRLATALRSLAEAAQSLRLTLEAPASD